MIIAIDGPAGVGKSSVSKKLSSILSFQYINSGNFYRTVTWAVLKAGLPPEKEEAVLSIATKINITLDEHGQILCDNELVEPYLHGDEIDKWVSFHSSLPEIRKIINQQLYSALSSVDAVVEGRDITTVVFPDADIKVYLDADIKIRAERRYKQGISALNLEEIESSIEKRDKSDKSKPVGRLKISEDALYLDTTDLTIDEVCEKVLVAIDDKRERT